MPRRCSLRRRAVSVLLGRAQVSLQRRAELGYGAYIGIHLDQPIAFGHMEIGTQLILAGVDRAAELAVKRHVVQGEPQRAAADRQTEFSNARCCPQLGQRESLMGSLSNGVRSAAASITQRCEPGAHGSSSIVLAFMLGGPWAG